MSSINEAVEHFAKVVQTQHGIIHVVKEMAKVMAEIGIASTKATGDSTDYAIDQWTKIMCDEAKELAAAKYELTPMQKKLRAGMARLKTEKN